MRRRSDAISSRRFSETWTSTTLRKASNSRAGPPGSFLPVFFASRLPPSAASGATERFSPRSASRGPRSAPRVAFAASARATAPAASLRSIFGVSSRELPGGGLRRRARETILAALRQGVGERPELVAPELALVRPVEVLVGHRVRVLEVAHHLDLAPLRERALERLALLARHLDLDAERLREELPQLIALVLELPAHPLAGLLDERDALGGEPVAKVLAERGAAELGAARAEPHVHLGLGRADGVHEPRHVLVGLGELQDLAGHAARRRSAAHELVIGVGRARRAGEPRQLGIDRVVDRRELLEHLARLGVAAVLVVDDRLEDVGLGVVLVLEVGGLEREEVPERLLVVADPVVGVGRLPQPLEPALPAPRHLPVVEDRVAVLPVLVVDPGELEERELAQLQVGPPRLLRVRDPDDVLERGRRAGVVALRERDEPVHELRPREQVARLRGRSVLRRVARGERRRRRHGLLAYLGGEPARLRPGRPRLGGAARVGQRAAALELVLREEVVDPVLERRGDPLRRSPRT